VMEDIQQRLRPVEQRKRAQAHTETHRDAHTHTRYTARGKTHKAYTGKRYSCGFLSFCCCKSRCPSVFALCWSAR
jgi:hypothetical protein